MLSRRALLALCLAAIAAAAAAQPVLQQLGTVASPPPVGWGAWADRTLAVTDVDARLVDWSNDELERARVLFELPEAPSAVESWGDSTLIQVPGEGGRLLALGVNDPTEWIEVAGNWHLPNTGFEGETYRVFVDPLVFLVVYSAPGPGGILGLLDFAETIGQADRWAWGADRALLSNDDGVYVVDINNPLVPTIQTLIEPPVDGWTAEALAVKDHLAFVDWGNRISVYDIDGPGTPPLLRNITDLGHFFLVNDRWLVSWFRFDQPYLVTVYDIEDLDAVSVRGTLELPVLTNEATIALEGDFIEVAHQYGFARYEIPAGTGAITDLGYAWPVLEGWPLATAGPTAWLQGRGRRYVVDLVGGGEIVGVQERGSIASSGALLVRGELLYANRGAGDGVSIESLADPHDPQVLAVLDPSPGLDGIDVAGDLLAAADGTGLVLYDVADPAAPVRRGELALAGAATRVLVADQVAVVTALRESEPDLAHVVDIGEPDAPQLVTSFELEGPDWDGLFLNAQQLVRRGDRVHVLLAGTDAVMLPAFRTATVDLTNPAAPALDFALGTDFWCFDPYGGLDLHVVNRDLPVTIGDFHVSFRADTVSVYADQGGADQLARLSSWGAPAPIATIAVAGNRLLVLSEGRLDQLTLSDDGVIGVPDLARDRRVRAVPNPFNPQTEIVFAMPRAGAVTVEIYSVRGALVRRLDARLPPGPARLAWRGDDQAGQAAPSGTYLLRVRTPAGVLTGRCQLVR